MPIEDSAKTLILLDTATDFIKSVRGKKSKRGKRPIFKTSRVFVRKQMAKFVRLVPEFPTDPVPSALKSERGRENCLIHAIRMNQAFPSRSYNRT